VGGAFRDVSKSLVQHTCQLPGQRASLLDDCCAWRLTHHSGGASERAFVKCESANAHAHATTTQETEYMRLLHPPIHSLRRISADQCVAHSRAIARSAQEGPDDTATRHEPRALTTHTVPADPYTAWLEHREAESDREERRPVRWTVGSRV